MVEQSSYLPPDTPGACERMAVIDLKAVRHNLGRIRELVGQRTLIAVVKANAYGHGATPVAHAVLSAGADMLGLAHVREALTLRREGIGAPLLAWMHTVTTDFTAALAADIELGVSGWELERIARAAQETGKCASVHLKIDTGLGRNGSTEDRWPQLVESARTLEKQGLIRVHGIFSHLAVADQPQRTETSQQLIRFHRAVDTARAAGLTPALIHLANTPATLSAADNGSLTPTLCNAVRVGLGIYGLSPFSDIAPQKLGLQPAMTLQTYINSVKEVPAGQGVSYGLNYTTPAPTTLALIPVGYADGIPRVATGGPARVYPATAAAKTYRVVGRIAMDQMVIDLGAPGLADPTLGYLGAPVVLFGSGENPSVTEWAEAAGSINYEIVTRISERVDRVYTGEASGEDRCR